MSTLSSGTNKMPAYTIRLRWWFAVGETLERGGVLSVGGMTPPRSSPAVLLHNFVGEGSIGYIGPPPHAYRIYIAALIVHLIREAGAGVPPGLLSRGGGGPCRVST